MPEIIWKRIRADRDPLWNVQRGVYAYTSDLGEILYIGKVHGTTVRRRTQPSAKPRLWNFLLDELGIYEFGVIVGLVQLEPGKKMSRFLLADIESLLINQIGPCGNISCRDTRISRPGLLVKCKGSWTYSQKTFRDM
jgi:hypothetical protein